MKAFPRLVVAAVFLVNVAGLLAQEALSLKQEWRPAKCYLQTTRLEQAMRLNFGLASMDQKSAMTLETRIGVHSFPDKPGQWLSFSFERLAMQADINGQVINVDSAKPEEVVGPLGNPFAGIVGKEIKVTTAPDGKGVDVENSEEILFRSGNPLTGALFQKDSILNILNQGRLQSLPPGPVKPGDTWPYAVDWPMPGLGNFALSGTYTFKGMVRHGGVECAEISFEGKVALAASAPSAGANPLEMLGMKLTDGSSTGTLWFDNALGCVRGSDMNHLLTMSAPNPTNPDETLSVPIKQHASTELTQVEDIQ